MKLIYSRLKVIMIALIFATLVFSGKALGRRAIPDNNVAYPVLIITEQVTGSGFYYTQDDKLYLVTARHVLFENSQVNVDDFPKKLRPPIRLKRKLLYDKESKQLFFLGTMSQNEQNEIINLAPKNKSFINAIKELYTISQLLKLKSKKANLLSYSADPNEKTPIELNVDFEALNKASLILYNKSRDIAAVELGKVIIKEGGKMELRFHKNAVKRIGVSKSFVGLSEQLLKKFDDVLVGNEVYIFGYPTSLSIFPEIDIKKPLLRRGVVAGKNDIFKTIILDCPVFFGNSGGLVIQVEDIGLGKRQYRAIGIISKFVPFLKGWKENSGYSIAEPIDGLIELLTN